MDAKDLGSVVGQMLTVRCAKRRSIFTHMYHSNFVFFLSGCMQLNMAVTVF